MERTTEKVLQRMMEGTTKRAMKKGNGNRQQKGYCKR